MGRLVRGWGWGMISVASGLDTVEVLSIMKGGGVDLRSFVFFWEETMVGRHLSSHLVRQDVI